ncbi:MAG TPA: 23S rRNA (adenine(2503)-C(2))-methyltransferase RlmN [Bryobacterales bacterium]|nr:23S rRNA (adenine(2503)-C(2))-methyltransferase RlmN [Bryobacterales bacterium]
MPQPLLGLEKSDLVEIVTARGEAAWRARQLYDGIYQGRAETIEAVPGLPGTLRRALALEFEVGLPAIEREFQSADGTIRYLLRLGDGQKIETVWMPEAGRDTICISTQAGCPVDCKFCFTALLGLARNLTAGEIVGQVLVAARQNGVFARDGERRRLNVVMMGMGEPLLNLPSVIQATRLLVDPEGLGLSPRRITLSTSGITPKIAELGREPVRPKLAVSLNASTEEMRERLMPITRKYKLAALLEACRAYPLRPWEKLSFEYVLLGGVNDSDADARRVVRLLANLKCMVNLIAFNPGPGIDFVTPQPERVLAFQAIVKRSFPCFIRKPRGRDIYAACGQLRRSGQP